MEIKAYYSKLESFALVDGPGVRSVLFLSGCPFRCLYCHNPETWTMESNQITVEEAYNKMIRFLPYWKNNGGVTISGGEPLLQMDFLIELFKKFKEKGVSTCIDTAGGPFSLDKEFLDKFDELLKYTDLFLMDIKAPNELLHKKITGKSILAPQNMFKYLNEKKVPIWIRYVLVPDLTDDIDTLKETKAFIDTLDNVLRIEVLPYHPFAIPKYDELKINYPLRNTFAPTKESIELAEKTLGIKA